MRSLRCAGLGGRSRGGDHADGMKATVRDIYGATEEPQLRNIDTPAIADDELLERARAGGGSGCREAF
jgi:hypothetical protein